MSWPDYGDLRFEQDTTSIIDVTLHRATSWPDGPEHETAKLIRHIIGEQLLERPRPWAGAFADDNLSFTWNQRKP